jgi:cytochrome c oxidase subunit II
LSDTRSEYQDLFHVYWPIGVGVFAVVAVVVLFVLVRFRSRSDELPEGRDESKPAEGIYAAVLVCVAAFLLYLTYGAMSDLDAQEHRRAPLHVRVTAAKWNWRFDYPRQRVTVQGTDGFVPTLAVPARTPVRFDLTSLDVQHAFWDPSRRFKRDAFPGRTTTFTLTFPHTGFGRGEGECAEFCGLRHSYMDFHVNVMEPAVFRSWAGRRAASGGSP